MSRINSAQQPLFAIAAPIWHGLRESIGRYLPKTELLRRTVPVLIAIFASLAAIGLVTQTLQSRQSAFSLAEERLALMADLTAVRLKDEALKPDGNWQAALAASLPKGATQDERTALLADADGDIKARAPMMTSENASLLAVLGPQQPLTTFGASAGVLRITLTDGTDAFVTVRDLPEKNAQVAFLQPVHAALSSWRRDASLEITLLDLHRARARAPRRRRLVPRPGGGSTQRRRRRPVTSPRLCPLAPSGAGISRADTCIGPARCIASSAGCRSTRPWPTAPSPNRCIPMTISAPPSIATCATADANSIRASACAMPTDIGSACGCAVTSRATRRRQSLCSRQSPPSSSRRSPPPSTPMRGSATPWRPSRKPSCCGTTRTAW